MGEIMIVVGIMGRIGAGKSTVARLLGARGAVVIDADRVAHGVLEEPEIRRAIADRFGAAVLDSAGAVSRPALAARVFGASEGHEADRADLERIVHPRVRRRIEDRLAALRSGPRAAATVVVLDVPLLMQAGWDGLCDRLVLVECDEHERQRRLAARGWSEAERLARDRAWSRGYRPPAAEKTCRVDASVGEAYTRSQVEDFWNGLPGH